MKNIENWLFGRDPELGIIDWLLIIIFSVIIILGFVFLIKDL